MSDEEANEWVRAWEHGEQFLTFVGTATFCTVGIVITCWLLIGAIDIDLAIMTLFVLTPAILGFALFRLPDWPKWMNILVGKRPEVIIHECAVQDTRR